MLKKVILITGANGEIGQYLIKELNRKNIENILAIDLHPLSIPCRIEQYLQGSIFYVESYMHVIITSTDTVIYVIDIKVAIFCYKMH